MSTALRRQLDAELLYERRRAVRALLSRPLLSASGPSAAAFALVRRHMGWLQSWFAQFPGWSLIVGGEVARLRKLPGDPSDGSRPARDHRGEPYSRRRYVLLCLALAVLEREGRQTTLRRLAEQVVAAVGDDPALAAAGIEFDLSGRAQRGDLVRVVRTLLDLRVLVRIEGEEETYLRDRGDVLYTIQRPALAAVLQVRRGPSTFETPGPSTLETPGPESVAVRQARRGPSTVETPLADGRAASPPVPATDAGLGVDAYAPDTGTHAIATDANVTAARIRAITDEGLGHAPGGGADSYRGRTTLYRRLLDDPIVYYDELDEHQRAYLDGQRSRLTQQIHEATGLEPEVRAEGIAMVDERGDLTDLGLPEEGTDGHLALLVAEHLAAHARAQPGAALGRAALYRHVAELVDEHGRHWRKAAREPGAEVALTDRCLARLEALRLIRYVPEGVVPRLAVGRYRLRAAREAKQGGDA